MTDWRVTTAKNTIKTILPFQGALRALKRRVSPPELGARHAMVVKGGLEHIEAARDAGVRLDGARVIELGTGWFPIQPLMFRAAGAGVVYLTDAHRLMDARTLGLALDYVRERAGEVAERLGLDRAAVEARLAPPPEGADLDEALRRLGMVYLVPFDERSETGPVDVFVSHTVLEHIPPEAIRAIFAHVRPRMAPGGVASHGVDHSDHRANVDPSLSRIDFLRYGERVWPMLCRDPQDYTNRLRHSDYLRLLAETGWGEVVRELVKVDRDLAARVPTMPLDARFRGRDPEDLATLWTHVVARAGPAASSAASSAASAPARTVVWAEAAG